MSLNHMADWFDYEYDSILGLKHISNSDFNPSVPERMEDDLEPIDWRDNKKNPSKRVAVTPVKDRTGSAKSGFEKCGGAYAVAVAEFLEGYQAIDKKKLATVSV